VEDLDEVVEMRLRVVVLCDLCESACVALRISARRYAMK